MPATKAQVLAVFEITRAVADAIKELKQVPSGELYARLMDKLSLADYEAIIDVLVRAGVVKKEHHLLTWIGAA